MSRPASRAPILGSDRLLARAVVQPVARFLQIEAAGGILLLAATVVALVWANSPWDGAYVELWHTDLGPEDLRHWVNDGLMAAFFFVVGLEIKGEVAHGQLSTRRAATLPAVAALGGMVVPAALYLVLNAGGDGGAGWGIPMATDIAFALGVLALLGDRVPSGLQVLLLALAIVDDIGAIAVIALAYTDDLAPAWASAAVGGLAVYGFLWRAGLRFPPVYVVLGLGVWFATLESGIHATIAGVALGLLTPVATGERVEAVLHPWTSYVVIPLFALANAGIPLSADVLGDAVGSAVTGGVVLGLVVGKVVGVLGASWLAVRIGLSDLPDGVGWRHLTGMAALAGIGFTVSIFISGLAFDDEALVDQAKLGVVAASVVAACLGSALLVRAGRRPGARS
jgi:NhaA family Na+:H+ antiporter